MVRTAFIFSALIAFHLATVAAACPLCGPSLQSIADDVAGANAVVVARFVSAIPVSEEDAPGQKAVQVTLKIVDVIKGEAQLKATNISSVYYGQLQPGDLFLLLAIRRDRLEWTTPLKISERTRSYLPQLSKLPKDGSERLAFFLTYLEDDDALLAQDACREFVKAPYATIRVLADRLPREKLLRWVETPRVAGHRQLYFMLLGLCGEWRDLPRLEAMLRSTPGKPKTGVDAMIACYLSIAGEDGLPLVEELFLKNTKAAFPDTYAAMMAIQFHITEAKILPRDRLLSALRSVLERPQIADLVIPPLVHCQDWSCVDKLAELFKAADDKSNFVKLPIINYLRVCPLPEAKQRLAELEKLDPETVQRAITMFPQPFNTAAAPSTIR